MAETTPPVEDRRPLDLEELRRRLMARVELAIRTGTATDPADQELFGAFLVIDRALKGG